MTVDFNLITGRKFLQYLSILKIVSHLELKLKSVTQLTKINFFLVLCRDKNGECLYTCAVRPAAIYGPGEERHLPRIINLAKLGLLPFKIGEPNVKSDWVYIDNLVLALILASMGLLDDIPGRGKQPVAAGQPYFISDGNFPFCLKLFTFVSSRDNQSCSIDSLHSTFFIFWVILE